MKYLPLSTLNAHPVFIYHWYLGRCRLPVPLSKISRNKWRKKSMFSLKMTTWYPDTLVFMNLIYAPDYYVALVMVMDFPTMQKRSGFGNLAIFLGFDRNRSAARQAQLANFSFCEDCMQRSSSGAGNFCRPEWPLHTANVLKLNSNCVLYTQGPVNAWLMFFNVGIFWGKI